MFKISEGAKEALRVLNQKGYEAHLVGGCVRDMIMGAEINDFDITTSAFPEEIIEAFKGKIIFDAGIKHGTITVVFGKENIEITTYRFDGEYLDNRHPESVIFTRTLSEDLARRDFTMNAIVYNPKDGIIDLFNGKKDIEDKIIRAIGEPEKRFSEDALRILRAIRFSSVLGFKIEENTRKAMIKCKHLLGKISAERITVELTKLLLGKNVKNVILENYEILGQLHPIFNQMHGFNQHNKWHIYDILEHTAVAVESVPPIPHLRLAMLFHDTGKPETFFKDENGVGHFYGHNEKSAEIVRDFLNKYKYDNFTKKEVYQLVKVHDAYTEEDKILVKKRLNRMGKDRFLDLIKIQRADNMAQNPELTRLEHFDNLEKMVEELSRESCFSLSNLAINGNDLIAIGYEGNSTLGKTLKFLLQEVIEERIPNEKEALIKKAIEYKQQ